MPIAITAITTKTLDDLQVDKFEDYAGWSRRCRSSRVAGAAARADPARRTSIFAASRRARNGTHSSSLPSVGTFLDEQPITTITGALDVHVFDIARIEALAGPQGTLYGASSQPERSGITNKPDHTGTYGEVQS